MLYSRHQCPSSKARYNISTRSDDIFKIKFGILNKNYSLISNENLIVITFDFVYTPAAPTHWNYERKIISNQLLYALIINIQMPIVLQIRMNGRNISRLAEGNISRPSTSS